MRRHRPGRTVTLDRLAAGACLVAALAAGCARPADPTATARAGPGAAAGTPAELLAVAAERPAAGAYRYEIELSEPASEPDGGRHPRISVTGAVEGGRRSATLAMGELLAGMPGRPPAGLDGTDPAVETVTDGATLYIRAPLLAALADAFAGEGVPAEELGSIGRLADLGDRWGRVEVDELAGGLRAGEVMGTGPGTDPTAVLDLLDAAGDPRPLGAGERRGVPVEGLAATVTLRDALERLGADPGDLRAGLGAPAPGDAGGGVDTVLDTPVPLEVWVDADGFVRRVVVDIDPSGAPASGDGPGGPGPRALRLTMDVFDIGDDGIDIQVPSGAVDLTDALRAPAGAGVPTPGSDFATG